MIHLRRTIVALALCASAGTVLAAQPSTELAERAATSMAVTMATLMGLSPEGQELLTADYLRRTTVDRHARSTQLYRAIGEELSRENPDRAVLSALAEEQAAEAARLDLQDSTQLFDLAFDLSSTDRQKMGQFMVKTAGEDRRAPAGR